MSGSDAAVGSPGPAVGGLCYWVLLGINIGWPMPPWHSQWMISLFRFTAFGEMLGSQWRNLISFSLYAPLCC